MTDNAEGPNQYLWDATGAPDPDVQRLEGLLARYRHDRPFVYPAVAPARMYARNWLPQIAFAALGIVCIAAALFFIVLPRYGQPGQEWAVQALAGNPKLSGSNIVRHAHLSPGEALETDANSRAQVNAGMIGRIDVYPNSRLRLVASTPKRHRLELEHGTIEARLFSPPFTFSFDTPSGTAYDVGCAFILTVGADGAGMVRVTSGWVQFELENLQELIPAGAAAYTDRERGPGTPFYEDATGQFKTALRELDFGNLDAGRRRATLELILQQSRARDLYTLLRLLPSASREERGIIFDRAAALRRPPAAVTREGIIGRDPRMYDDWVQSLGLGNAKHWWVNWKDAL